MQSLRKNYEKWQKDGHGWAQTIDPTAPRPTARSTRPPQIHIDNALILGISTQNLPCVLYCTRGSCVSADTPCWISSLNRILRKGGGYGCQVQLVSWLWLLLVRSSGVALISLLVVVVVHVVVVWAYLLCSGVGIADGNCGYNLVSTLSCMWSQLYLVAMVSP